VVLEFTPELEEVYSVEARLEASPGLAKVHVYSSAELKAVAWTPDLGTMPEVPWEETNEEGWLWEACQIDATGALVVG
jgi:hypothetical protein